MSTESQPVRKLKSGRLGRTASFIRIFCGRSPDDSLIATIRSHSSLRRGWWHVDREANTHIVERYVARVLRRSRGNRIDVVGVSRSSREKDRHRPGPPGRDSIRSGDVSRRWPPPPRRGRERGRRWSC